MEKKFPMYKKSVQRNNGREIKETFGEHRI